MVTMLAGRDGQDLSLREGFSFFQGRGPSAALPLGAESRGHSGGAFFHRSGTKRNDEEMMKK